MCGSHDGREVYAVTHDLMPTENWIMQFKVKYLKLLDIYGSIIENIQSIHIFARVEVYVMCTVLVPKSLISVVLKYKCPPFF